MTGVTFYPDNLTLAIGIKEHLYSNAQMGNNYSLALFMECFWV